MIRESAENIFNGLTDELKGAISILSVPSSLTEKIAEQLLRSTRYANGNAAGIVRELKSLPVWIQRNRTSWAIDAVLREIALGDLNGGRLEIKREVLNILKEYHPDLNEYSYTESKDFQLQISRLALSIPEEQERAISSLRSFFETAELFDNYESSRVISVYIDESLEIDDQSLEIDEAQKQYSESMLSAFYIRGLHAYRTRDKKTALKYLIPVWKQRGKSVGSLHDAGIASHLVGLIYSKDRSGFAEAEDAYQQSLKLRILVNDIDGLAQTYHSLGNLYGKKRKHFKKAEEAYRQSLKVRHAIDDKFGLGQVYHSLGNLYSSDEKYYEKAEESYQKSFEFLKLINDKYGLAQVYHSLGNLYSKENRFNDAEDVYQKSLKFGEQINHTHHLAQIYHNLGNLYRKNGRFKEAEKAFENSLRENKKLNDRVGLAQVYMNFGRLKISQRQYKEAKNLLTESLRYERNNRYREIIKRLIRNLPI